MEKLHIKGLEELDALANTVLGMLALSRKENKTSVLAISGDLGAGKTTFMQAFAKQLQIEEPVISPTYVIMKKYAVEEESNALFQTLIHMDVYRIETIDEMRPLRFEELLELPDTVMCIEWAEKIKELLPAHTLYMGIKITGENSREILFT